MKKLLNRGCRDSFREYRGCREGAPLSRHEFLWGLCTGGVKARDLIASTQKACGGLPAAGFYLKLCPKGTIFFTNC